MARKAKSKSGSKSGRGGRKRGKRSDAGAFRERAAAVLGSLRHLPRAGEAGVVVVLLIAWIVGLGPLREHVSEIRAEAPVATTVRLPSNESGQPPAWVPPEIVSDLQGIVLRSLRPDPLDRESLEVAFEHLRGTGWFARLDGVERAPNGDVIIDGVWRQPFAVVRHDEFRYVVGREGRLMRLPDSVSIRPGSEMFEIINPVFLPPVTPGGRSIAYNAVWPGGDIEAALELIDLVRDIPGSEQIRGVDLSRFARNEHLVLVTNSDTRIDWGAGVGAEKIPGEVDVAMKIARLVRNYRDFGRVDRDTTPKSLDLYTLRGMEVDRTANRE